ncbi:unnamed protein product [Arctia plantaginis]|uniref:Uncharacterized protein n=1 Tax=Arctia plantaginis TaxID=874455 RepID=A0A8S1ANW0_ARCPL|nr:unnamed protein product [Arctia plantaginis]
MAKRRANKVLNNEKIISFLEDSDDSVEDVTWKPSPKKVNKYSNISKIQNRKRGHEVDFIVQTSPNLLPIASFSSPVVPITDVSAASTPYESPQDKSVPPAISPVIGVLVRSPTSHCQSPGLPDSPSILQEQFDEDYLVQAMSPPDVLIPPATPPTVQIQSTSQPVKIIQFAISPTVQGPTGSPPVIPDSPPISQAKSDEDSFTQTSKQSRKRQKNISTWKKNIRKQRRNEGKEYVSTKGKTVPAKVLESFNHVCRYQCNSFTESERKTIHSEYWNLGSWEAQTNFIRYCVQIQKPKRSISKKKVSTVIILNTKRVCKDFFLKALTISNRRFTNAAFTKTPITGLPVYDKRGKHEPGNKTNEDKLQDIRAHIKSFPKFKSHYSREDAPFKRYLSPELSVAKMYSLYKEKVIAEGKQPVKDQIYRKVFNNEFNLGFYKLRSDTCNTCDRLENLYKCEENAEKRQNIKEEKTKHLLDVERTREIHHTFYNALKSDENFNKQSSSTSRARGRPRQNSLNETDEESVLDYTLDE